MEAYSGENRTRTSPTSKITIAASDIVEGLSKLDNMIDSVFDKSSPKWITDSLTHELNGLFKLKRLETWALIFSEKITFDSGVGRFLPRLAKAGIKIVVIAKTDEHKTIIDYLNAVELENFDNKILYFDDVMKVTTGIKGIQIFSYFKVEDEEKEYLPKNVVPVDEMTVREIIDALGKTCGFVGKDMEKIYTATELFGKAA